MVRTLPFHGENMGSTPIKNTQAVTDCIGILFMKSSTYLYNDYYSRCDNINKYIPNSVYNLPDIECIIFDVPLLQLLETINVSQGSKYPALQSYSKCYYIFYIAFLFFPYINFKKSKKIVTKNYALKFIVSNNKKKYDFIYSFFTYLASNINSFSASLNKDLNQKEVNVIENKTITSNVNYKVPMFYLYDLNPYFNQFFFEINLKSLNFYINIKFTSTLKTCRSLKNLALFWI